MVAALALSATASGDYTSMPRSSSAAPGEITLLRERLPDPFYVYPIPPGYNASYYQSATMTPWVDAANGLAFEVDGYSPVAKCPDPSGAGPLLMSFDLRTYTRLHIGCPSIGYDAHGASNLKYGIHAMDSTDRVFFSLTGAGGITQGIVAVSEDTLKVVGTWSVPAAVPGASVLIEGLAYNNSTRELFVQAGNDLPVVGTENPPPPEIVELTAFRVAPAASGVSLASEGWVDQLNQCQANMSYFYGAANPVRTVREDAVLLGCRLSTLSIGNHSGSLSPTPPNGILKIHLDRSHCPGAATPCPNGSVDVAVVPGQAGDVFFDPYSERGFMPTSSCGSGCTVLIYDGEHGTFMGRTSIGDPSDQNGITFGLDTATGRFYALGQGSGLTAIDGRRTPLPQGNVFSQFKSSVDYVPIAIVPASTDHPFTRVLVPTEVCGPKVPNTCAVPDVSVFADELPLTQDPPSARVDQATYQGSIDPGTPTSISYSGAARGFGAHSLLVGSFGGVVNNIWGGPVTPGQLPLSSGNRDQLLGVVDRLGVEDGNVVGSASAAGDGNGSTGQGLDGATSGQVGWPYPAATCSFPGGKADSVVDGARSGNGSVVGDSSEAHAETHCSLVGASPAATGEARLRAVSWTGAGVAPVEVGKAQVDSSVSPESTGRLTTTVTAIAGPVRIDLPGGLLQVGRIEQVATAVSDGRPGHARATRQVTISDLELTVDGQTVTLCSGICKGDPQQLAAQIDAAFPAMVSVLFPEPDATYAATSYGSPGGYQAAIQASALERYGDQQFNAMPTAESTYLPAMRIVLYNDGDVSLSREILDFAGVETDAQVGVEPLVGSGSGGPVDVAKAQAAAGVPAPQTTETVTADGSASSSIVPVTLSSGVPLSRLIERAFDGITWLLRSPKQLLQMLGAIALFGAPLVVMDRRRAWVRDVVALRATSVPR